MATQINDNVYLRAGETLRIEVDVKNSDGSTTSLVGAIAKMGILIDGTVEIYDCTIDENTVIAIVPDEDTVNLDGNYKYEIVLQTQQGEVKSLAYGIVVVYVSLIESIFPSTP